MYFERITKKHKDVHRISALYTRAFPQNERHEFDVLLDESKTGMEMLSFYDEGKFCGFAVLLNCNDISHIVYFAVPEELRGCGYGSRILDLIRREKTGCRILVDIEQESKRCDNPKQRRKRRQFYLRNGYRETKVKYHWRGDDYAILSYGGDITDTEFERFWEALQFNI